MMANNQLKTDNFNGYYNSNITFDRIVSKFSEIVTPKTLKNVQSFNLTIGGYIDPSRQQPALLKSPSVENIYNLSEQIDFLNSTSSIDEMEDLIVNNESLAAVIESTLREEKSCLAGESKEIVTPAELSSRVAEDIVKLAEDEPCGLKGCVIYINYEDKSNTNNNRCLGTIRCDSNSVPTFEVLLSVSQDYTWLRHLPFKGCWRKLKNKAVVICNYTLTKKKLYCFDQQC